MWPGDTFTYIQRWCGCAILCLYPLVHEKQEPYTRDAIHRSGVLCRARKTQYRPPHQPKIVLRAGAEHSHVPAQVAVDGGGCVVCVSQQHSSIVTAAWCSCI